MTGRLLAIVLVCCALLEPRIARASEVQHWIVTSDIHFDPFADVRLIARLNAAPFERWRAIFQSAGAAPFSPYGADANYSLLESALDSMKTDDANPAVVIIAGDFLARDFRAKYQRALRTADEAQYESFVDKTVAFLAREFRGAFPRAQLLPVIGNDDSYCGEYAIAPQSAFLSHMAAQWAGAADARDAASWAAQFSKGGYYAVELPVGGARAIVLNDVYWSTQYKNTCSEDSTGAADEMAWLRTVLATNTQRSRIWIIAHIPPGADVAASLRPAPKSIAMFLRGQYNDDFVSQLGSDRSNIVMAIAGHTHMNAFRIVGVGAGSSPVPMLVVPSISPALANNPAYEVLNVESATASVLDYHVVVLDDLSALAKNGKHAARWRREYDFASIFGPGPLDAKHLAAIEHAMFADGRLRERYKQYYDSESGRAPIAESAWRATWCANVALTQTSYAACAMPQVQLSLPPQPTAPPGVPSPVPSP